MRDYFFSSWHYYEISKIYTCWELVLFLLFIYNPFLKSIYFWDFVVMSRRKKVISHQNSILKKEKLQICDSCKFFFNSITSFTFRWQNWWLWRQRSRSRCVLTEEIKFFDNFDVSFRLLDYHFKTKNSQRSSKTTIE